MTTTLISRTMREQISIWIVHLRTNMLIIEYGTITPTNVVNFVTLPRDYDNDEECYQDYNRKIREKIKHGYTIVATGTPINYDTLLPLLPKVKVDLNNLAKPMKCQHFRYGLMRYPAFGQGKINGCRCIARWDVKVADSLFTEPDGFVLTSKEGIVYNVPQVTDELNRLAVIEPRIKELVFDGELYCFGETVTTIVGASKNTKNPVNKKLVFITFDLAMDNMPQSTRLEKLTQLQSLIPVISADSYNIAFYKENTTPPIYILDTYILKDDNEALNKRNYLLDCGFEGIVLRDMDAEYQFGMKPSTMLKWKKELFDEFIVIDIVKRNTVDDFNLFILQNDTTDERWEISCTGTASQHKKVLLAKNKILGKPVMVKYYERTITGLPFHCNILIESVLKYLTNE